MFLKIGINLHAVSLNTYQNSLQKSSGLNHNKIKQDKWKMNDQLLSDSQEASLISWTFEKNGPDKSHGTKKRVGTYHVQSYNMKEYRTSMKIVVAYVDVWFSTNTLKVDI